VGTRGKIINVGAFSRDQSTEFILKVTGQDDRLAASQLASLVSDNPQLLGLVGRMVESQRQPLMDVVNLIRRDLSLADPVLVPKVLTLQDAFRDQISQIRAQVAPRAESLLNLCSFFGSEDIPLSIFLDESNTQRDPVSGTGGYAWRILEDLSSLNRFAVVTIKPQTFSWHPAFQAFWREELPRTEKEKWAERAVKLLHDNFPSDSTHPETWNLCSTLMPHVKAATGFSEQLQIVSEQTANLVVRAGTFLSARAELHEGTAMLERAVEIASETSGATSDLFRHLVFNLALNYETFARLGEGIELVEQALKTNPDDPALLARLGTLCVASGRYQKADQVLDRVERLSPEDVRVLVALGQSLLDMGYLDRAESILHQALSKSPFHWAAQGCLSIVLLHNGNPRQARDLLEVGLAVARQAAGPTDPRLIHLLIQQGYVLQSTLELEEACGALQEALEMARAHYGEALPLWPISL